MSMHDEYIYNMMSGVRVGKWVIELTQGLEPKLYCDDNTLQILSIGADKTPEYMYKIWYERLYSIYKDHVKSSIEQMKQGNKQEVVCLWEHPKKGIMCIRWGGTLAKQEGNTYYLRGYHNDITDIISDNDATLEGLNVLDLKKSKKYVAKMATKYDELFELNVDTMTLSLVYHVKDKYVSSGYYSLDSFINECIYAEDADAFRSILKKDKIKKMLRDKEIHQVEFRKKMLSGEYRWVCANCFVEDVAGENNLIFYTIDVQQKKDAEYLSREKEDIIKALVSIDSSIIEVDFQTSIVKIMLYDSEVKDNIKKEMVFYDFIDDFIKTVQPVDRKEMLGFMNMETLKKLAVDKNEMHVDVRMKTKHVNYEWVRFSAMILPNNADKIFILAKSMQKDYLLQHILEKFMYKACDFLYYIDLRNDWYMLLMSNDPNTALPIGEGYGYFDRVKEYVYRYAKGAEQDIVLERMKPDYLINHLDKHGYLSFTTGIVDDNGNYAHKSLQCQYFDKESGIVLLQRIDITENYMTTLASRQEIERLSRDSMIDHLTCVYNRKGYENEVNHYLKYCSDDTVAAFLLIDLDNFKSLNDELGHQIGDEALKDVARILKKSFRSTDIVCRLGGDEFVVLLKDIDSISGMDSSIKKLINSLNLLYKREGKEVKISASIGVSIFPKDGHTIDELYCHADKAMYDVKKSSKNSYMVYSKK